MNIRGGKISAAQLARYVIWYANEKNIPITQLKLQKLLYFIQVAYLRQAGDILFDDPIEAWEYGPVVRSVYIDYCDNGSLPLHAESEDDGHIERYLNDGEIDVVQSVLNDKLNWRSARLVRQSHSERPWMQHKEEVQNGKKPLITADELRTAF